MRLLLLGCLLAGPLLAADAKHLAVLELNASRLEGADKRDYQSPYYTDLFRQKAVQLLPKLFVLTRENLTTLLQASGKDISQCEGTCAIDTARLIGADYVVAGDFSRVGPSVKLTLTLYDARAGNVLAGTTAAGRSPEALDESAQLVADDLFAPLAAQYGGPEPYARKAPPRSGSPRAHIASIVLGGAGVAAGLGAGFFAWKSHSISSDIQNTPQATRTDLTQKLNDGQSYNSRAIALGVIAGVALAVAVPLYFATLGAE